MLAALAERTRTLRLGIAIILLPLSHPLRVAEEIATLDVISNGRVEFGIGRGAVPNHFRAFGVPIAENRDRFVEGLEVIRQAWTSDRVSFHGRFFDIERVAVVPKPVQQPHPPIGVAVNSEETLAMTGRMGLPIYVIGWTITCTSCKARKSGGANREIPATLHDSLIDTADLKDAKALLAEWGA